MPFGVVSGVGREMRVLDGVQIIEGEGAVWGWIWDIPLYPMGNLLRSCEIACTDRDAICGGEWGQLKDWGIRHGSTYLKGKGRFRRFFAHWFEWHIFNRNVFDSCVEHWKYFHIDNISLEMSVHWLSEYTVSFKIEVGYTRNLLKCSSDFTKKNTPNSNHNMVKVVTATITWLMSVRSLWSLTF